eukprot:4770952-Prymnesium_polylepis.2
MCSERWWLGMESARDSERNEAVRSRSQRAYECAAYDESRVGQARRVDDAIDVHLVHLLHPRLIWWYVGERESSARLVSPVRHDARRVGQVSARIHATRSRPFRHTTRKAAAVGPQPQRRKWMPRDT